MRRGLAVVVVALLSVFVFKSVFANKMLTQGTGSQISINGLQLAHPDQMKSLPADLIPLP
jgi:hypothetical protein